jgi:hypothetical protein
MDRYIKYDGRGLSFLYNPTRKEIMSEIERLIKENYKNIQVIKTRYTKCTCKKCGNVHNIEHESVDESFTEFINTNMIKT